MAEDDGEAEDDTGVTGAQQPAPTAWSIHTALLGFYVSAETQAQHFVIRADVAAGRPGPALLWRAA